MSFNQLAQLKLQIYEELNALIKLSNDGEAEDRKHQHSQIIKRITTKLLQYKSQYNILEGRIGRDDGAKLQLQLYKEKLVALKIRVRELQLYTNQLESELVHQQRIKKYGLQEENEVGESLNDAKDKLFANRSGPKKDLSVNDRILSHNKNITTSLQATRQLMSTSVLQSELNIESLDQQTKDLHKLNEGFIQFNDLLVKSKQIVRFIEKQDKSDKQRIYLSLGFFLVCCAWVIWRRILRMPVRIMLWSFFKVFRIFSWLFASQQSETSASVSITAILATEESATLTALASAIMTATSEIIESLSTEVTTTVSERLIDEL